MVAGLEPPDAGRIRFDGLDLAGVAPERRRFALMFQDFALFPHLSILDNVRFGLIAVPKAEARVIALRALDRVGLAHLAESFPHQLSGGEQQRVALARALVPRPQVLLMDEPFSGLDQRLRDSVRAETMALLRETRASCLLVTHDPVEAMSLADRIFLMREGRLIQAGPPEELYRRPVDADAARFFSDAAEIPGQLREGKVFTLLGAFPCPAEVKGPEALVLIRPQGIRRSVTGSGAEGLVSETCFEGERVRCTILFKGLEAPVDATLQPREAPRRGETSLFEVDPEHVFVFESTGLQPI
jgi:iron(III) transport system ATP-binding protein